LIEAIAKSKANSLNRLVFGLGIRHVGVRAAWILSARFKSLDKIADQGIEGLEAINEIGPIVARSIYSFFRMKENKRVIEKLTKAGVNTVLSVTDQVSSDIEGKIFVITGSLESFSRQGAEELIRRLGGNASSSVSKKTDYLVLGREAGSKLAKAKKFGVKIIDEKEFKKMTS